MKKKQKKVKQCQYGIANYPGDIYTNVETGGLTLSVIDKAIEELMKAPSPDGYYDASGYHKIS